MPNEDERHEILRCHASSLTLSDVDFAPVARMTEHFSGADLKAIMTNAQLLAVTENGIDMFNHLGFNSHCDVCSGFLGSAAFRGQRNYLDSTVCALDSNLSQSLYIIHSNALSSSNGMSEERRRLLDVIRSNMTQQRKSNDKSTGTRVPVLVTQTHVMQAALALSPSISEQVCDDLMRLG